METMKILFIEEYAPDYLKIRDMLEAQAPKFNMDWGHNYEVAAKQIKTNSYDFCLISSNLIKNEYLTFLDSLPADLNTPIILLVNNDDSVDRNLDLTDKYQIYWLSKDGLNWPLIERSIRYLSNVIALRQKLEKFQGVFEKSNQFMLLTAKDGILQDINQTALKLIGSKREELLNNLLWDAAWAIDFKIPLKEAFTKAVSGELAHCKIDILHNEQAVQLDFSFTAITNAKTEIVQILIEGHDLSQSQLLEQQLAHCNLYDKLTELPSRQLFSKHLEQAMARAQQSEDYYIAVLLVDLDNFRMINATLGHDMGDWLLMEMTRRLQDFLSKSKLKTFLGRACGDEFIILLDNIQDLADATQLAIQINELLARPLSLVGYELVISAKIGIAYYSDQEESTSLLRDADAAMYRAKAMPNSNYTVFNRGMRSKVVSRLKMETDLQKAIKEDKFVLFYHPQINLASNELVAMEALIRFYHPQKGLILPNDFVPVLEETGDIIPIGEWIFRTACQQLKDWWLAGFLINHITVNLSSYQFRSKNLIKTIVESIESAGLEPDCLVLEITESLLLEDADFAIKTLGHLRDIGVKVAIDDFGTGYASLNYLKRFPADYLKIDNSFIEGGTPQDTAITIATIDMAHALGLLVVGEGVETIEQAEFLRDQACDLAQGYLYTVPLNQAESLEWIQDYAKENKVTPL